MLQAFLIKKPFEISFTGNPMPYTFALTPYGGTERTQDIRLVIRVLIENVFNSGSFTEVKSQAFYPNDKGEVSFDVKKIIHSYLEYFLPNPGLQVPLQATNQRKRYRVDYLIQKDGTLVGDVEQTAILYALKGGMAYDQWHPKEFFTNLIVNQKQGLQFAPLRNIAFDELRYFFWLYPYNAVAAQTVMIDILLDDQSTIQYDLPATISVGKWGVCCTPIGFNQIKLYNQVPAGRTAISYSIQVKTPGTSIVAPVTYMLEQRNFYNTTQLFYRNSAGGIETICLRGQIDFETDQQRQAMQRTVPPSYFNNMVLQHQSDDANSTETSKFKGDTGFLNREATDRLRDFFLSPQKYEVLTAPPSGGGGSVSLLPITVVSKNTKFFSNQENLVTTLIEWQRGYANEYYTPNRAMSSVRACPALESFAVTQINKNLLQIMYALESPYDRVKVEVETSLGIETFYFTGNASTLRQPFTNPVLGTSGNEDIEVRGYCVCDEFSTPMDLGPVSTVNLNVVGNTLPIANDDNYTLAVGFNTPVILPGSVLANDYDPDGDPIEAVVQTAQTSDAGGTYDLDAAGIITYEPPSSVYSGIDFFDYEMREVGGATTVTARAYINVGSVAGGIYAKIVVRNEYAYGGGLFAEFWLDFFADPSGTTPIDVTGMSITFDVNQHEYILFSTDCSDSNTDTAVPVAGAGIKIKFWEGVYYTNTSDPGRPCPDIDQITFALLPGTGYIVI